MVAAKVCTACGEEKPFSEFAKHKLGLHGLRPRCRSCTAIENAVYRARTVEQRADYNRRYRLENRDRHLSYNKAWNRRNRARLNEAVVRWRERNPEKAEAHRLLKNAIRAGLVVRPEVCDECGDTSRLQGHHHDYAKPLEVEWLCSTCHGRR